MPRLIWFFLVVVLLLSPSFGMASAVTVPDDLTVHLSMDCPPFSCYVDPFLGGIPGNYAVGSADFSAIGQPWSYNFQTGLPLSWTYDEFTGQYSAQFGVGGSFLMDGPDGLTFVGEVTSGDAWQGQGGVAFGVELSFFGQWSNGLYGYGTITDQYSDEFGPQATLNAGVVPEPAGLTLLGTGVVGIWGWRRRSVRAGR